MSFHQTVVEGFLARDPEVRYTADGTAITNFSIPVGEKYKDTERTTWYRVTVFGKQAESASTMLKKGSSVIVSGRIQEDKYTDKEGVERTTWGLRADTWRFTGRKDKSEGESSAQQSDYRNQAPAASNESAGSGFDNFEDDLPF